MGMMAVFRCSGGCGQEEVHGCYQGHPDAPNEFPCVRCRAKKKFLFVKHVFVDERNESQRMRDRLKEAHAANAIETR